MSDNRPQRPLSLLFMKATMEAQRCQQQNEQRQKSVPRFLNPPGQPSSSARQLRSIFASEFRAATSQQVSSYGPSAVINKISSSTSQLSNSEQPSSSVRQQLFQSVFVPRLRAPALPSQSSSAVINPEVAPSQNTSEILKKREASSVFTEPHKKPRIKPPLLERPPEELAELISVSLKSEAVESSALEDIMKKRLARRAAHNEHLYEPIMKTEKKTYQPESKVVINPGPRKRLEIKTTPEFSVASNSPICEKPAKATPKTSLKEVPEVVVDSILAELPKKRDLFSEQASKGSFWGAHGSYIRKDSKTIGETLSSESNAVLKAKTISESFDQSQITDSDKIDIVPFSDKKKSKTFVTGEDSTPEQKICSVLESKSDEFLDIEAIDEIFNQRDISKLCKMPSVESESTKAAESFTKPICADVETSYNTACVDPIVPFNDVGTGDLFDRGFKAKNDEFNDDEDVIWPFSKTNSFLSESTENTSSELFGTNLMKVDYADSLESSDMDSHDEQCEYDKVNEDFKSGKALDDYEVCDVDDSDDDPYKSVFSFNGGCKKSFNKIEEKTEYNEADVTDYWEYHNAKAELENAGDTNIADYVISDVFEIEDSDDSDSENESNSDVKVAVSISSEEEDTFFDGSYDISESDDEDNDNLAPSLPNIEKNCKIRDENIKMLEALDKCDKKLTETNDYLRKSLDNLETQLAIVLNDQVQQELNIAKVESSIKLTENRLVLIAERQDLLRKHVFDLTKIANLDTNTVTHHVFHTAPLQYLHITHQTLIDNGPHLSQLQGTAPHIVCSIWGADVVKAVTGWRADMFSTKFDDGLVAIPASLTHTMAKMMTVLCGIENPRHARLVLENFYNSIVAGMQAFLDKVQKDPTSRPNFVGLIDDPLCYE